MIWRDDLADVINESRGKGLLPAGHLEQSPFALKVRAFLALVKSLLEDESRLTVDCLTDLGTLMKEVGYIQHADEREVVEKAIAQMDDFLVRYSVAQDGASLGEKSANEAVFAVFPDYIFGGKVSPAAVEDFSAWIFARIREGGTVEDIEAGITESFRGLFGQMRERMTEGNQAILRELENAQNIAELVMDERFEELIRMELPAWISEEERNSLVSRLRIITFNELFATVDDGVERMIDAGTLDEAKVGLFWNNSEGAIAALSSGYQGRGLVLATGIPENGNGFSVFLDVLGRFSQLIDQLQVLIRDKESARYLNRNALKGFKWGIQMVRPGRGLEAVSRIQNRNPNQEAGFMMMRDGILPSALLMQLNSVQAEIDGIPDARLQEMALTASLLLLFKLARLKPEERKKFLENGETLRGFLTDNGLEFLQGKFGVEGGVLRLLAAEFVQSFTARKALETAA